MMPVPISRVINKMREGGGGRGKERERKRERGSALGTQKLLDSAFSTTWNL